MHRTQIYLDDRQDRVLRDRASASGRTKSALIRDALDAYLAPPGGAQADVARLRAAVAAASGAAPYLPTAATTSQKLRQADRERQRELHAGLLGA